MDEEQIIFLMKAATVVVVGAGLVYQSYMVASTSFDLLIFTLMGRNPFKYFSFIYKNLPDEQLKVLQKFPYYGGMPGNLQRIFVHRVADFISKKNFEGRDDLEVTDEMKVLIAATAVQLTFGMTYYKYRHYDNIIIYPDAYFSTYTGKYHLGEVNPFGSIVFSWPHFQKGYTITNDNLNLGLHEFAHAIFVNKLKRQEEDLRLGFYYEQFNEVGTQEFFRMKRTGQGFLREYAATNMAEFFAVSVEYFFESPHEMKAALPGLYQALAKVLGQDPTRWVKI